VLGKCEVEESGGEEHGGGEDETLRDGSHVWGTEEKVVFWREGGGAERTCVDRRRKRRINNEQKVMASLFTKLHGSCFMAK